MKQHDSSLSGNTCGIATVQDGHATLECADAASDVLVDSSNIRQDDYFIAKSHVCDPVRLRAQFEAIGDIADAATADTGFPEFCCCVAEALVHATGACGASFFLYLPDERLVRETGRFSGVPMPGVLDQYVFPVSVGRISSVIDDGKIIVHGPKARHQADLPSEQIDIGYEYGITVPIFDGDEVLGAYALMFSSKVYQNVGYLLALSKVLASHIKLMGRAQRAASSAGKAQLALQILNSIENVIGPLAMHSGIDTQLNARETSEFPCDMAPGVTSLSCDDVGLLMLVAKGYSNESISNEMHLSESAVKKRISALMRKLHMDNRVQLCAYAFRSGFVE